MAAAVALVKALGYHLAVPFLAGLDLFSRELLAGKNDIEPDADAEPDADVVGADDSFWLDRDDRSVHIHAKGGQSPHQRGSNAE